MSGDMGLLRRQVARFVKSLKSDERGGFAIQAAAGLAAFLGMGALAVDMSVLYDARGRLQNAADIAAEVAAFNLPNTSEARTAALEYAEKNLPSSDFGLVLTGNDIEFGVWNQTRRTFAAGAPTPNAVRLTTRRSSENGNSAATYLANIFGIGDANVSAVSMAALLPVGRIGALPIGLRTPNFGPVDPRWPHKPGPSDPGNGNYFEIGEAVTLFYLGKGRGAPVHLVLDIVAAGCDCNYRKVLEGLDPPTPLEMGDLYNVIGEGSGHDGDGVVLARRLDLDTDDPGRTVIVPVVALTANSRNSRGELDGEVEVVDFLAVHLDGIIEEDIPDPEHPGNTIGIRRLTGTIVSIFTTSGAPAELSQFLFEPSVSLVRLVN